MEKYAWLIMGEEPPRPETFLPMAKDFFRFTPTVNETVALALADAAEAMGFVGRVQWESEPTPEKA